MAEYFGRFSVGPDGRFVPAAPRPKFKLLADFAFEDRQRRLWKVPSGTEVDGASIPRLLWTLIGGPFEGNYIHASIVHDHYCVTRKRSAELTHETFYFGMRAKGVPDTTAKKMYWGVLAGGPKWRLRSSGPEGVGAPLVEPLPDVDLEDPATREEVDRRFESIAQSLDASGGDRFAASDGTDEASLESIAADAERFRAGLAVVARPPSLRGPSGGSTEGQGGAP